MSDENIVEPEAPVEESVTEEVVEETQVNPLSMSDEEFDAYLEAEEVDTSATTEEATVEESDGDTEEVDTIPSEEENNSSEESTEASEGEKEVESEEEVVFSKENAYDEIMAEFKANGKMMSVKTVADVRQLMKMGANYNKKMAGMKPKNRIYKMLEDNELLDESKLNYLIDLSKKDKGAIQQLLKDSQLDPLDLDVTDDSAYTPNTYTVDDRRVQLDEVLASLQDTEAYSTTVDIIGNKWDKASRDSLLSNPNDISIINQHVETGLYEKVMHVVDRERMLGKLNGVSDFDAYTQVGRAMEAQGAFKETPTANVQQEIQVEPKKADPVISKQKRAAAPTKGSNSKPKAKVTKNPLAMSDEEFEKAFGKDF